MTNAWLPLMRRRPIVRVAKDLPRLSQPDHAPHEVNFVWGMQVRCAPAQLILHEPSLLPGSYKKHILPRRT